MTREQFESCIAACNASAEACNQCAVACLFEPNREELARCVQLDMDCAEICRLAAAYMARGSELTGEMCAFCADVCDACAEECERHEMSHCRKCAAACRACAQECRNMLTRTSRSASAARSPRHGAH